MCQQVLQLQGSNRLSLVNGAIADVERLLQGPDVQSYIVGYVSERIEVTFFVP